MYKEIKIGKKAVPLYSSGATPIYYSRCFGKDCIKREAVLQAKLSKIITMDQNNLKDEDMITMAEWDTEYNDLARELCFIMAMQASHKNMNELNEDSYVKWLNQFENVDINDLSIEIMHIFNGISEHPESKKKIKKQSGK